MSAQARLFDAPLAGVYPVDLREANELLERFEHRLGPVRRPYRSEAFALEAGGRPVAVAVSASVVGSPVASAFVRDGEQIVPFADRPQGFDRQEVVELARLAASERWANRVMLRIWREICAPAWQGWAVLAAVSYSQNSRHSGDLYRFDGWRRIREDAGSPGGGSWSSIRDPADAVAGSKSLWIWRYQEPA